jgi:hypothetical protein
MEEFGFTSVTKGQSRLADLVKCKPQALNQVLSGRSNELSAGPHSRVCSALGIEAVWLSDGTGSKYRPPAPQKAQEEARNYMAGPDLFTIDMPVSPDERALVLKLRQLNRQNLTALRTIVDALARGPL